MLKYINRLSQIFNLSLVYLVSKIMHDKRGRGVTVLIFQLLEVAGCFREPVLL